MTPSPKLSLSDAERTQADAELFDLLRIPSVSADPAHKADMLRAADFLQKKLSGLGFAARVDATAGHPVVYAERQASPTAPTVLIYGHYDVQPEAPLEEWQTPPFEPTVRDGRIYARGATDDKGQAYAHIRGVELLLSRGELPLNVKFLLEGEEEVGSANLEPYLRQHAEELACDAIVISDGSRFAPDVPTVTYGLRGLSYVEVLVQGAGRDLHSGSYGGAAPNPINALAQIISKLKDDKGHITIPGFYDNVEELTEEERQMWAKLPHDDAEFAESIHAKGLSGEEGYTTLERLWARPTLDVNGIWGGYQGEGSKTVIAAKAGAKISMRARSRPGTGAHHQTCPGIHSHAGPGGREGGSAGHARRAARQDRPGQSVCAGSGPGAGTGSRQSARVHAGRRLDSDCRRLSRSLECPGGAAGLRPQRRRSAQPQRELCPGGLPQRHLDERRADGGAG